MVSFKEEDHGLMQELLVNNSDNQNSNSLSVSSAVFQNAGATITQQLAYSLAETHYYLNYLNEKGLLDGVKYH